MSQVYEIRPRRDRRGVDLVSEALPFGSLWYAGPNAAENADSYAVFCASGKPAVVKVLDAAGELVRVIEHAADTRQRAQLLGGL